MPEKSRTLIALDVSNVKRAKLVRIKPNGAPCYVIGGKNAQGKSSVLDALEMAIGGKSAIPSEPIRRGARRANVVADFGDLKVERTITADGSTELVVRDASGAEQRGPQHVLDKLFGKIAGAGGKQFAFDPLSFATAKVEVQDATLKEVLKLNFHEIDSKAFLIEGQRKQKNKEIAAAKALLPSMPEYDDVPNEEVSVAELGDELRRLLEHNQKITRAGDAIRDAAARQGEAQAKVDRLELELKAAREALAVAAKATEDATAAKEAIGEELDTTATQERMRTAEATNAKVRANHAREDAVLNIVKLEEESEAFTTALEELKAQKQAKIAAANFPVPNLSFDPDVGPLLNGFPLEQASTMEKLKLGVALVFAANPAIKIAIIRNGWNDLDAEHREEIARFAEEQGGQLLVERVTDDGSGCSVILEDGEVKVTAAPADEQVHAEAS